MHLCLGAGSLSGFQETPTRGDSQANQGLLYGCPNPASLQGSGPPAWLTQVCSSTPGEKPQLGPHHLCHPSRPGPSPASYVPGWSGKGAHQRQTVATRPPTYSGHGQRSPGLHPNHVLLTHAASQVSCSRPTNRSPRAHTGMFLVGRGCLADGQSSRLQSTPPIGASALGAGRQGKAKVTSCREPLRVGEKELRYRLGPKTGGWRVLQGPQAGAITGRRGLELELSCTYSPDSNLKGLFAGKEGLDRGLEMGHSRDPTRTSRKSHTAGLSLLYSIYSSLGPRLLPARQARLRAGV